MAYAQSRSGFIAYPHATQSGVIAGNRAMNRLQRQHKLSGGIEHLTASGLDVAYDGERWMIDGKVAYSERHAHGQLVEARALIVNAKHDARFQRLIRQSGAAQTGELLGTPTFMLQTRFGPWEVRFNVAESYITANFQTRDRALLEAASRATGSNLLSGKLGFHTDRDAADVIDRFEATLRQVVAQ